MGIMDFYHVRGKTDILPYNIVEFHIKFVMSIFCTVSYNT